MCTAWYRHGGFLCCWFVYVSFFFKYFSYIFLRPLVQSYRSCFYAVVQLIWWFCNRNCKTRRRRKWRARKSAVCLQVNALKLTFFSSFSSLSFSSFLSISNPSSRERIRIWDCICIGESIPIWLLTSNSMRCVVSAPFFSSPISDLKRALGFFLCITVHVSLSVKCNCQQHRRRRRRRLNIIYTQKCASHPTQCRYFKIVMDCLYSLRELCGPIWLAWGLEAIQESTSWLYRYTRSFISFVRSFVFIFSVLRDIRSTFRLNNYV